MDDDNARNGPIFSGGFYWFFDADEHLDRLLSPTELMARVILPSGRTWAISGPEPEPVHRFDDEVE